MEKVLKYIREERLLRPGDRVAVACSGGADSVALLRILVELREALGIVLTVAHFHHQIRGAEADADQQFVRELAATLRLEFYAGSGDVPAHAAAHKISLETAAREVRHHWFAELIKQGKADKIATAHTMDDQAETVLMRVIRGAGARGLAGIAPEQKTKHLVRPLLTSSRAEIEGYLRKIGQPWREDSSNQNLRHTRNRIRHTLMPLLESEFNPAIRQTLAGLGELARAEEEYWNHELAVLLPRLVHEGKPSRSGRSSSGEARGVLALDIAGLTTLPLAVRRQVIHATVYRLGVSLEFKHIQQLISFSEQEKPDKKLMLPDGLTANRTLREIHFSRCGEDLPEDYCYTLPIPGEVVVPELGFILRARVISDGKKKASGYNAATFLNPSLLGSKLTVRNWRAGDRFFPAHSQSPKKIKELLQPGRLGQEFSSAERKNWPVIESAGQIVWMRGFAVSQDFASRSGDAVLIEEIRMSADAEELNGVQSEYPKILLSAEQIKKRVQEMARQIANDFRGKTVHVVGVMENGFVFMADLVRELDLPVVCQFVKAESKEANSSTTEIFFSPELDVQGQHVLLVEALVQSGLTSEFLIRNLVGRGAASVKLAVLLDKQSARRVSLQPDYFGFLMNENFVVGYGLGERHFGRNLPYIAGRAEMGSP